MIRFITRSPRVILAATAVLTALLLFGLRNGLILDVSPLGFVERGSQERANFEQARKNFGPEDYLIVTVVCDDIFLPANLEKLKQLHTQLAEKKGVAEILSLINAPYARGTPDGARLEMLLPATFQDRARLEEARKVAVTDRLYVGNLVSADGKMAALNLLYKPEVPTHIRHEITRDIYETTRKAGFSESYFAGDPFSQWHATQAVKNDLRLFLPLTVLLIATVLWRSFRSWSAVLIPMGTIGIGLCWLFGVMGYLQSHFTILDLMLPTLMLAIGCSYIIHVINQIGVTQEQRGAEADRVEVIEEALRFIALPVLVSALTIIAGFLSLAFNKIPAIRSTGVYSALGAFFTCVLSLTFIPAALVLCSKGPLRFRVGLTGRMVRVLETLGRWSTTNQMILYVATALIIGGSVIGVRRILIDVDFFHFFKPEAVTSVGVEEISKRLSGAIIFEFIVEGKTPGAVESPEVLKRIEALQEFAAGQSDPGGQRIDRTVSAVDFLKHLNRAFHNNDPQSAVIPTDPQVIEELFSDRDQIRNFLSEDRSSARILVRSTLWGSQAMASVIARVVEKGRELLPDFRVFATGTAVLLNRTSDQIAKEQTQSITIALVTIYLMLALLFRSARVGFTALVPNLIPVLFFFGFMGWRGIPLNLTTSLVASVVLGLAVDNAVQFIVRFRRIQQTQPDLREAIIESMRLSGRPIIYANVALASAFAIFAFSSFEPISSFGLLSAVTILGCLVEDLVLLPARLTSAVFKAK